MAIRQNPAISNRHTGYIACSGYGKSQALKQNPEIPKTHARVLLWDADHDHKSHHFDNRNLFLKAVLAGMKSGKGFRLAWDGRVDVPTFEWFCTIAWNCLDGERDLYIILEELADVQPSMGKASDVFGQLCRRCRKYGGVLHWTSQRSQEISKTVFSQTENFYIGYPNKTCKKTQAQELALLAGCHHFDALYRLKPLEFYKATSDKSELIKLKYKNI